MTGVYPVYPIGTPGVPWTDKEKTAWRATKSKQRDYFDEVISRACRVGSADELDVFFYGQCDYRQFGFAVYPLVAIRNKKWDPALPLAVVTGGVHGYETSGVQGAILFAQTQMEKYVKLRKVNVLVLPDVSPFGYECIERWTPLAIDPNRCFDPSAPGCIEAELAMKCIAEHLSRSNGVVMHTDLHETTDTDNTLFTPQLIARDGKRDLPWDEIPDGYYSVANTHWPDHDYHAAVIAAVEKVTHIAEPDARGNIIGEKMTLRGCVHVDGKAERLCGAVTAHWQNKDGTYAASVTTEIYPDSKRTNPDECNRAQVAVITASLDYVIAKLAAKQNA